MDLVRATFQKVEFCRALREEAVILEKEARDLDTEWTDAYKKSKQAWTADAQKLAEARYASYGEFLMVNDRYYKECNVFLRFASR